MFLIRSFLLTGKQIFPAFLRDRLPAAQEKNAFRRLHAPARRRRKKRTFRRNTAEEDAPCNGIYGNIFCNSGGRNREARRKPLDRKCHGIKKYRNSQGGVQVPTGGEPHRGSPRARFQGKRRRSGESPGPTVTVRKKEHGSQYSEALSSLLAPLAALMLTSPGSLSCVSHLLFAPSNRLSAISATAT